MLVHLHKENYAAALENAELLLGHLESATRPASSSFFENIADAFSFSGQIDRAQYCLERAAFFKLDAVVNARADASSRLSWAVLSEAKKEFKSAIDISREVLDQPVMIVMNANRRCAARSLFRSYSALGKKSEAAKWKQFAREEGRVGLLGDILASQFRQNLTVESPAQPLSPQELSCLSLSAHGQTSADIALKLGIKTRTINFHISKVLRKLNAANRQEAIAKAVSANLLQRL